MLTDPLQKKELYPDKDFPFVLFTVTSTSCNPPGPGFHYLHWHEDLQFTIITRGTVSMEVNGITYTLKMGDGIFINCGLLHMTSSISEDGEYISFNFPTKLLSYARGSQMELDYVLPFTSNYSFPVLALSNKIPWQKQLLEKLLDLKTLCKQADFYGKNYEIVLKLSQIWLFFIRNVRDLLDQPSSTFIRKQGQLQAMLAFIHGNFMHDITLEQISECAHISKGECCRCFKKTLHATPYEYLINFRLNQSADLLRETDLSVSEIATQVGFNDSSHFIQMFRRKMSLSPIEYRKNFL